MQRTELVSIEDGLLRYRRCDTLACRRKERRHRCVVRSEKVITLSRGGFNIINLGINQDKLESKFPSNSEHKIEEGILPMYLPKRSSIPRQALKVSLAAYMGLDCGANGAQPRLIGNSTLGQM